MLINGREERKSKRKSKKRYGIETKRENGVVAAFNERGKRVRELADSFMIHVDRNASASFQSVRFFFQGWIEDETERL